MMSSKRSKSAEGAAASKNSSGKRKRGKVKAEGDNRRHDPSQNKKERSEIRQNYRKIMADTEANKAELQKPGSRKLLTQLEKLDENFSNVKMTREAALDAEAFVKLARYAQVQAQQMNTSFVTTTPHVLEEKLAAFLMGAHDEIAPNKWSKVGEVALRIGGAKLVPTIEFMNGPLEMDVQKKVIKQRERVKVDERNAVKPQMNQDEKLAGQGDINSVEDTIWSILEDARNVQHALHERTDGFLPVMELCTNPKCFAQTVENLFGLAGLVTKGKAGIKMIEGEDDEGTDLYAWQYQEGDDENEALNSVNDEDAVNSMIFEFGYKQWKDNVAKYEMEADDYEGVLVPHRDYTNVGNVDELRKL